MTIERVPFAKRDEAYRKLHEWTMDRAREAVRKNCPAWFSEEMVDILAQYFLDRLGRETFEKSKAGHHT